MTNDYESIKSADAIMVIGSNTTETHPVIASMIKERVRQGASLIVCDPRRIELAAAASVFVQQRCGTDTALLNSMMNVIIEEKLYDEKFITERTEGFKELYEVVRKYPPEAAEGITGVPAETIRLAARTYGGGPNAAVFYTMGITQHTSGTNNVRCLCDLAMLCGNLGRPGTGVNPLRGQGNVQGACDMGCLPLTLPGYLKADSPEGAAKVREVWGCELPKERGLSVAPMMAAAGAGTLKALFIMGENPAVTDADTKHTEAALNSLDFMVVQDIFLTETAALADVVLPAACWPEKDGTCTNTIRAVQRLRKACNAPGEARDDWRTFGELARRMGYNWRYTSPQEIFEEIRRFVPSYAGVTYDRLDKGFLQWPCPNENHPGTPILHSEKCARPSGKMLFLPCEWDSPHETPDTDYPFMASTGRTLYHYHSGSMTRRSALSGKEKELYIEINPKDAAALSINNEDFMTAESRRGEVSGRARLSERVPAGMVFIPFHFSESAANQITASALDPTSETPAFKVNSVRLRKGK